MVHESRDRSVASQTRPRLRRRGARFLARSFAGPIGSFLGVAAGIGDEFLRRVYDLFVRLFTENLYKPLVPGKTQRHYINVGRTAALIVVIGGIYFAFKVPDVVTALKIWFKIAR